MVDLSRCDFNIKLEINAKLKLMDAALSNKKNVLRALYYNTTEGAL